MRMTHVLTKVLYSQRHLCGWLGFALKSLHFLDHPFFKFIASLSEMSFSVIVWTECDNIRHSIFAYVCKGDYVMTLQITAAVWLLEPWYTAILTFTIRSFHHRGAYSRIA